MIRRVGVIGTGLIGGSLLLALQRAGVKLSAVDPDPQTRALVRAAGIDDVYDAPGDDLRDCDVVVLATPLPAVLSLLSPLASRLSGSGAVLTDVAGAKGVVAREAARVLPTSVPFVPAHPMAGRERGGFDQAQASLFESRMVAVCPEQAGESDVARVEALWALAGANTLRCDPDAHDEAVARVSHLPYLMACTTALVADEGDDLAHRLAATGLKDTTRVATDATIRFALAANPAMPALLRQAARHLEMLAISIEEKKPVDEVLDRAASARRRLYPNG